MHNPSTLRTRIAAAVLFVLALSACSPTEKGANGQLTIVVTTTILGDVVQNIVGDAGTVEVLMPIGIDPHDFSISVRQITSIVNADLVIINGLGLEAGLDDVFESATDDGANIFSVGEEVVFPDGQTDIDPHFWMDEGLMAEAAHLIADEIGKAEPNIAVNWQERGADYASKLVELAQQLDEVLMSVPDGSRKLVTNHDSLGYLAHAHGFEIIGTVFPGRSPEGEPSAEALAALVEVLRANDIRVIFGETTEPSQLAEAVAAELGDSVQVVELFTGSLGGVGSGAETYLDFLRANARLIADALGS